jgi:LPXTG-motif cell wall-anchored protein
MKMKKVVATLCAFAMTANLFVGALAIAEEPTSTTAGLDLPTFAEEFAASQATENTPAPVPLIEAVESSPAATATDANGVEAVDAVEADEDEEAEGTGFTPLVLAPLANTTVSLKGNYAVTVPNSTNVVNYVLLEVTDTSDEYASVSYTVNGTPTTPTVVATDAGHATYVKLEVPAGVSGTGIAVATTNAASNLSTTVNIASAGIAAPSSPLYGTVAMNFSEFFYDVTASITAVQPTTTSFAANGTVASPTSFIAAGTKSGNLYPGGISWATSSGQLAVDAVSTATFGDSVHFSPSKALRVNYQNAITEKGEGHAITGIKAVEVGVSFDLLANASLLEQASEETAQSTAVLEKIANITWIDADEVYKAKYLFPNASWGARDADAVNDNVADSFPALTTTPVSYGGNWTIRQLTANFNLADAGLDGAGFWDNYLEYIYGGYIEDGSGHRQPLVWLQNLFSHKGHQNFDVSINNELFSRFDSLTFPGSFKVVVFAQGFEDVVLQNVHLASFINSDASIEQGTVFHVDPTDNATWFEETGNGHQLHIQGFTSFNAQGASLSKGSTPVETFKYSIEKPDSEVAVTFDPSFFTGDYQGSYTLRLVADTNDVKSKPLNFTVNKLVDWPTLNVEGGPQGVATANVENTPLSVAKNQKVTLSNADLAKTLVLSGRSVSAIQDLTASAAVTPVANVIKHDGNEPYYLDLSTLTAGHTYRFTLLTGNYSVATGQGSYSTSLVYYLTVTEPTTPNNNPVSVTDTATGIVVTASPNIPLNELTITKLTNLEAAGLSWLKHGSRDLISAFEIHFATYQLAQDETLSISFPIDGAVASAGDKLLIHHGYDVAGKNFEEFEPTVANGRVEITVSSLSPFVVHAVGGSSNTGGGGTGSTTGGSIGTGSDTGTGIPATGDTTSSQLLLMAILFVALGSLMLLKSRMHRAIFQHSTSPHFKPIPRRKNS